MAWECVNLGCEGNKPLMPSLLFVEAARDVIIPSVFVQTLGLGSGGGQAPGPARGAQIPSPPLNLTVGQFSCVTQGQPQNLPRGLQ